MTKKTCSMLLFLLCFVAAGIQAESVVAFNTDRVKTSVGEIFTVDIVMGGFPNTEGGGITLRFNPAVVRVIGVAVNEDAWSFVNRPGTIDNNTGAVTDILFSSYQGVSDSAMIATVTFEAIGKGKSSLDLEASSLSPFASGGDVVTVKYEKAIITSRGVGNKKKEKQ